MKRQELGKCAGTADLCGITWSMAARTVAFCRCASAPEKVDTENWDGMERPTYTESKTSCSEESSSACCLQRNAPKRQIIREVTPSLSASQQLGEEENTYATLELFIFQHAVTTKDQHVTREIWQWPWLPRSNCAELKVVRRQARREPANRYTTS